MNGSQIGKVLSTAAQVAPAASKLKEVSQELEAIFLKDLLAAMRKTAKHAALGSSLGGDLYQDTFDTALADSASRSGRLGIGQTIFTRMAPHAIRSILSRIEASEASSRTASTTSTKQP